MELHISTLSGPKGFSSCYSTIYLARTHIHCTHAHTHAHTPTHTHTHTHTQLSTRQHVYIHPSSCLFHIKPQPQCVVYSELVHTTKCYMRLAILLLLNCSQNYHTLCSGCYQWVLLFRC